MPRAPYPFTARALEEIRRFVREGQRTDRRTCYSTDRPSYGDVLRHLLERRILATPVDRRVIRRAVLRLERERAA